MSKTKEVLVQLNDQLTDRNYTFLSAVHVFSDRFIIGQIEPESLEVLKVMAGVDAVYEPTDQMDLPHLTNTEDLLIRAWIRNLATPHARLNDGFPWDFGSNTTPDILDQKKK